MPYDPTIEELEQMWPEMKGQTTQSSDQMGGGSRAPSFDEMNFGDVYGAGGNNPTPASYNVSPYNPSGNIQTFLKDTGFLDTMMQKEKELRQKHLDNIKRITGVKEIQNEKTYMFSDIDTEKTKQYETLPDDEKTMIQQIATGKMQPQDYLKMKQEKEKQIIGALLTIVENQAKGEHELVNEKGDVLSKTAENYRAATQPKTGVALKGEGNYPNINIYDTNKQGGGGGGRRPGGGGGGEGQVLLTKPDYLFTQAKAETKETEKYVKDESGNTIPIQKENLSTYNSHIQKAANYTLGHLLVTQGMDTHEAERIANTVMNIAVANDSNGDLIVDNKLNIARPEVMRALQKASYEGLTAKDVYAKVLDLIISKRPRGLTQAGSVALPDYGNPYPEGMAPPYTGPYRR